MIVGGLFIPRTEGVEWIKREHGLALEPDHSEDLTIPFYLADAIEAHDYPYDIELVRPQGSKWLETMLVTQWAGGPFVNTGPLGVEEILQGDLKEILKPASVNMLITFSRGYPALFAHKHG